MDKTWPVVTGERLVTLAARKISARTKTFLCLCTGLLAGLLLSTSVDTQRSCWSNRCRTIATNDQVDNYFDTFQGFAECQIRASELYTNSETDGHHLHSPNIFCGDRNTLLQALSNGGRIGFDAPYMPRG